MTATTTKYKELKEKHEKEYNDFTTGNVFFAYSDEQFEKGMASVGLTIEDTDKIFRTMAGGYILKTKSQEQHNLFLKWAEEEKQAIAEDTDGTGYVREMFQYEMANHEYGYTRDISSTLDALGYTIDEINADPKLLNGFKIARQAVIDWDNENN